MGDAEDIVFGRRQQQMSDEAASDRRKSLEYIAVIKGLIPKALANLKARGYPERSQPVEINAELEGLMGSTIVRRFVAWKMTLYDAQSREAGFEVYLLSDGRLLYQGSYLGTVILALEPKLLKAVDWKEVEHNLRGLATSDFQPEPRRKTGDWVFDSRR